MAGTGARLPRTRPRASATLGGSRPCAGSVALQLDDRAAAVKPADRFGEEGGRTYLLKPGREPRVGDSQRRNSVSDHDALDIARTEHRVCGGRKYAMRGGREDAYRSALAAGLRRTDDGVAGGDKIVDDDRDLAIDVADQRIAGQDAAAAIFLRERGRDRATERSREPAPERFGAFYPADVRRNDRDVGRTNRRSKVRHE